MISFSSNQSPTNAQIRGLLNDVCSNKIDMRHILNPESMNFFEKIQESIIYDLQSAGTNRNLNVVDGIRKKHFKKIVLEQVDSTSINVIPVGLIALSILMDNEIPDFRIRNFRSYIEKVIRGKRIQERHREKFLNSPDTFRTQFTSLPSTSLPSTSSPSIQIPSSAIVGPSAPPSPEEIKQILEFMLGIENIDARHQFVGDVISVLLPEDFEHLVSELMEFPESEAKTELLNYLLPPVITPESDTTSGDLPLPPSSSSTHESSIPTGSSLSESPSGSIVGPSAPPSDDVELDFKSIEGLVNNFISLVELGDEEISSVFVKELFEKYSIKDIAKVLKVLLNSPEIKNNNSLYHHTIITFIGMLTHLYEKEMINKNESASSIPAITIFEFPELMNMLEHQLLIPSNHNLTLKELSEAMDRVIAGEENLGKILKLEFKLNFEKISEINGNVPPPPSSSSTHESSIPTGSSLSESPSGPIVGPSAPPSDDVELDFKSIEGLVNHFISLVELDDEEISSAFVKELLEKYSIKDIAKLLKVLLNSPEIEKNKKFYDNTVGLLFLILMHPYLRELLNGDGSAPASPNPETVVAFAGLALWLSSLDRVSALKACNEVVDHVTDISKMLEHFGIDPRNGNVPPSPK